MVGGGDAVDEEAVVAVGGYESEAVSGGGSLEGGGVLVELLDAGGGEHDEALDGDVDVGCGREGWVVGVGDEEHAEVGAVAVAPGPRVPAPSLMCVHAKCSRFLIVWW